MFWFNVLINSSLSYDSLLHCGLSLWRWHPLGVHLCYTGHCVTWHHLLACGSADVKRCGTADICILCVCSDYLCLPLSNFLFQRHSTFTITDLKDNCVCGSVYVLIFIYLPNLNLTHFVCCMALIQKKGNLLCSYNAIMADLIFVCTLCLLLSEKSTFKLWYIHT